jgi:bacillithiol synthase
VTDSAVNPAPTGETGDSQPIPVDVRRFPWIRKLASDYAYDFDAVAPFFSGNPAQRRAWSDTIARVQGRGRHDASIADVLLAQQARRGAPDEARAAAERLRDPHTVAIVTGQQAGLFGGPLFTLLKAITALKLADCVQRKHQVPAVAIFWIDAEDHDWDEVASCDVLDADLQPRRVTLPRPANVGEVPVAAVRIPPSIEDALSQLSATLPRTEFTDEVVAGLRSSYTAGAGMADAFGAWLERVLGRLGLIVYDSSDPATKPLVREIFAKEVAAPGETSHLATVAGNGLMARGYHAQVHPHDGSLALFHLGESRRAIRQQDNGFVIGDAVHDAAALRSLVASHPAVFSPNVLLRPIVQDTLFPTICYVAGPNELGYLGQLKQVYEHFRVPMPLMHPRATATLLDSSAVRFLRRYDVPLESLHPQDESALNALLERLLPPFVEHALESVLQAVNDRMTALIEAVPVIDPTLEGAARSTQGRMQHDLQTLHGKIIHAAKRKNETLRRQFARAQAQAFPGGHPQERAVGFVYFLNRYGPALVDRLAEQLPLDLGRHWIVSI